MIIQGDNGTRLKLHINEDNSPVDLTGATVDVRIKIGTKTIEKTAQITDIGICEIELTSDDVSSIGVYRTQVTVKFVDETLFSSDIQQFAVGEKL